MSLAKGFGLLFLTASIAYWSIKIDREFRQDEQYDLVRTEKRVYLIDRINFKRLELMDSLFIEEKCNYECDRCSELEEKTRKHERN